MITLTGDEVESYGPGSKIKPDCYHDTLSPSKKKVWHLLEKLSDRIQGEEFRIDATGLAEVLGVSRATISHALKTLVSDNLLEKVREVRGRGNHSVYLLLWTFYPENETPSRNTTCYDSPPRYIAKGSSTYRYFAMQFRQICEQSTLKSHSGVVVGKILKILEGRVQLIWRSTLIFFERLVEKKPDLVDFFVWLSDFVKEEIRQRRKREKTEKLIKENREIQQTKTEKFSEEDPLKLSDFDGDFEALAKALEKHEQKAAQ